MSVLVAAGCSRWRSQGVSVVPMIQCGPHGITNSTDRSVRRISPPSAAIRSRGTSRWTPFDAWTRMVGWLPDSRWMSSVHTPVQLTTAPARTAAVRPVSVSRTSAPTTRAPSRMRPVTSVELRTTAPWAAAVRATVSVWRASSVWASQ